MNIQSFLRMKNLFGQPMVQNGIDTSSMGGQITEPQQTNDNLLNQFQPKHDVSNQLAETSGNMPERPVPSRLRSVGAAIAGLGAGSSPVGISMGQPVGFKYDPGQAHKAEEEVKYGDFNDQLNDWQNKVKALAIGANEEDKANFGDIINLKNQAITEIGHERNQVAQQRADSYQQNADTKIQEETDKHTTAMQKHADNIAKLDQQMVTAKQNYELHKNSTEALAAYHKAELASIGARRLAQTEDDAAKLKLLQMHTNSLVERNRILNEATQNGKETDTSLTYDKPGGNVVGKKVVSGPAGGRVLTDPDGNSHDISTWTSNDIAQAKLRGWK